MAHASGVRKALEEQKAMRARQKAEHHAWLKKRVAAMLADGATPDLKIARDLGVPVERVHKLRVELEEERKQS